MQKWIETSKHLKLVNFVKNAKSNIFYERNPRKLLNLVRLFMKMH